MVKSKGGFACLGFHDGYEMRRRKGGQVGFRLRIDHATARHDHRLFRRPDRGNGRCQFLCIRLWPAETPDFRREKAFGPVKGLGLHILAEGQRHRAGLGRRYGTSGRPDDLRQWDADGSAQEVCSSAGTMLYADYVEAGQMPAVLANRFGGVIFHEACGHLLETTQVERGTTPFADKVGDLIAHEAVTAIDEGLSDGAFGSLCMDDEGMEPQRTVLIENGVLKRFLSDRAGELRTGHARTGSGRRQGHSFAAASRMRNTFIAAGPHSPDELIASVDQGLYCKSMGGGSVGPTGQFNFAVEEGYLIENGKLTKPVKGATLIGEAKEVMPRISMCANDLELAAGFCGSVSGNIFVTVGQPHIKVDSITVGGR